MSTRFDEEECIVCELRPPGDSYFWQEWLADRLDWELIDGQNIQPPPLTPDEQAEATAAASTGKKLARLKVNVRDTTPYAKLVYRGEKKSVQKVWKSRPTGIQIIFQGVMLSVKPVGLGQFTPTQFGPNCAATVHDIPDSVEFDMNEDNNALQSKRDLGRKLTVEESSILDVIDELGTLLPLAQTAFEMHAKVVDQDGGTGSSDTTKHGTRAAEKITPYACCKAIGSLLELNITVEELLLDESNKIRNLDMHSALTRMDTHTDPATAKASAAGQTVKNIAHLALQGLGQSSKFPQPTMTYIDFLYILLRLKRLKEEDPNIVSPRESARGSARAGTGMGKSLGGNGDTFGNGAGVSAREIISGPKSPRNTVFSPRTSMMLANAGPSGGVMSPRPYQSLTHSAGAAAAAAASLPTCAKSPSSASAAHEQVPGLSLESVLQKAATESFTGTKSPKSPNSPKASPRVTMRSPKQNDKENKEKHSVLLWDSANTTGKPAATAATEYAGSTRTRPGGGGKDDPRVDAMRRHRIAALESRGTILQGAQSVFGEAPLELGSVDNLRNAHKAVSAPMVPRLRLPPEPGRAISPPTRMDKYIDESLKRRNFIQKSIYIAESAVHSATMMQSGFRVLPMSNFPRPAKLVEPRHWLTTLNFYEQLSALMPMFIPANKGDGSNRQTSAIAHQKKRWRKGNMHVDTGEEEKHPESNEEGVSVSYSGKSVRKEQWLDEYGNETPDTDAAGAIDANSDLKVQQSGATPFALPVVEVNTTCRAYQTVRRAFQSCDVNCFYFDKQADPAAEQANSEASEIFFSDLTAVMDALNIRSRVVFSADTGNQFDDVFVGDSYCNNPCPVQMNIEGWRTSKDRETGLIAGTGTALWTCLPAWWKQQWNSYLDTRRDLKNDFEKKIRKFRNVASRRKLKVNETKNFLAITDIVQKLNAEIDAFGDSEVELASGSKESKEQAVRRLSWDMFLQFMNWVVESSGSNANEIRHMIAEELWKNTRNTAISSAAKFIIAMRIEKDARDKILAMAPVKVIEKKDKDFRVQKNLFVGYFPKTDAEVKAEMEAAMEEKKEKGKEMEMERQMERELQEKQLTDAETQAKHFAELRTVDDKRDDAEQDALANDTADDFKVALAQRAKAKLATEVTDPVAAAPLNEEDLQKLTPSCKAEGMSMAAMFAEADEKVAEDENVHAGRYRAETDATSPATEALDSAVPAAIATTTANTALSVTATELPKSAGERIKFAQAEKEKRREEEASAMTSVTPAAPKEKLSARERFKVAQAEKEKKEKEEEEAVVAEMLTMAADARKGKEISSEKAVATAPSPLSARQRFKNAQVNKSSEKNADDVEEDLDYNV